MDQCPVCGMDIDPEMPPVRAEIGSEVVNFCCEECRRKYEENPGLYTRREAA